MYIYDNRDFFYQWDLDQKVVCNGFNVGDEVHFFNMKHRTAPVVKAYELDGMVVADVPNILLQSAYPLIVYRVIDNNGKKTLNEYCFKVKQRPQPDNYIYTETEVFSYKKLEEQLEYLETEGIELAVTKYLDEHPTSLETLGGQPKPIDCNITLQNNAYVCDKTYEELIAAHSEGKDIIINAPYGHSIKAVLMTFGSSTYIVATSIYGQQKYEYSIRPDNTVKFIQYTLLNDRTLVNNTGTDTSKVMTQKGVTDELAKKQDKLTGTKGQVVSFDSNGHPVAIDLDWLPRDTEIQLVDEKTVNVTGDDTYGIYMGYVTLPSEPSLYAEQSVVIYFDNVRYETVLIAGTSTTKLDVKARLDDGNIKLNFYGNMIECYAPKGVHTFSVCEVVDNKLPEKFLPDAITQIPMLDTVTGKLYNFSLANGQITMSEV